MAAIKKMNLVIGADHRGFEQKNSIIEVTQFGDVQVNWLDVGTFTAERSDYPEFAIAACRAMQAGNATGGILLCGTGVGMAIVANRFNGIFAALVWTVELAQLSKTHDNANVLVLPSDYISAPDALAMIDAWLHAQFLGERHGKRVKMIEELGGVR